MNTDSDLIVRPATRQDLTSLLALYQELDQAYGLSSDDGRVDYEALWRQVAADSRQQVLVAVRGDIVLGSATVAIILNLGHHGRPWAAVENVVVRRDCRGQGIGTVLLTEAGRIARNHDCYKLALTTNLQRRQAHAFYHRLGWQQTHAGFSLLL